MKLKDKLRAVLYADQASDIDFTVPQNAAIVRSFQSAYGSDIEFLFVEDSADFRSGYAFKEKPDLVIVPGIKGEKSHYYEHIGPAGSEHLRTLVRNGGVYWGVCAGGYLGGEFIGYSGLEYKTRQGEDLLRLLPVHALGPIEGYCKSVADKREQFPEGYYMVDPIPVTVMIGGKPINIELPYGFGPRFEMPAKHNHKINVSAWYNTKREPAAFANTRLRQKYAAAIDGSYGAGHVFLTGVLAYYDYQHYPALPDHHPAVDQKTIPDSLEPLRESLLIYHAQRKVYWNEQAWRVAQHRKLVA